MIVSLSDGGPGHDARAETAGVATVLVVDDNDVDRKIAGGLVAKGPGLRAAYAEDGERALVALDAEAPVAIVTDLQMPGMDGLALVQEVRRLRPEVPVIL